jgi:hypothetical protein
MSLFAVAWLIRMRSSRAVLTRGSSTRWAKPRLRRGSSSSPAWFWRFTISEETTTGASPFSTVTS